MSVSKSQIKLIRSLQQKKQRDLTGLFVAEGRKTVEELRKAFSLELLVTEADATPVEIEQMSAMRTPQGVIGVFRQRPDSDAFHPSKDELVLALDGIQDPGNLGTIIRTADWFGVRHIVCSRDTADCYNPKVVQATMGALARVQLHYTGLETTPAEAAAAGISIYGTLLDGRDLYSETLTAGGIVVMGNEGNGISRNIRNLIGCPLRIPSYPTGEDTSESLNVAVATAVTLAEFRRRSR